MKFRFEAPKAVGLVIGRARQRKRRKGACQVCGARGVYVVARRYGMKAEGTPIEMDVCALCRREGY